MQNLISTDSLLGLLCLLLTLILYAVNKRLYYRCRKLWLMPVFLTPFLLIVFLLITGISHENYARYTKWLLWLLGPATIAFAVPIYENKQLIRQHWLSLSIGVFTALIVSVLSSVWLAQLLSLPEEIQRSLAVHSATTPFAIDAAKALNASPELAALFVAITGLLGILFGHGMLKYLAIKSMVAKATSFGAATHAFGTAKAYEINEKIGMLSSLTMVLSGIITVLSAPIINHLMW